MVSPFVGVDGEALSDEYNLLASSQDESVYNPAGLSTRECFDFLLSQARPKSVMVCFGLNYDVNNWLRDVRRVSLEKLWQTGTCVYGDYKLRWIPSKYFEVENVHGKKVRVNEVIGFFQSSFIKALEDWGLPVSSELEEMKAKRGGFTEEELVRVRSYCISECKQLVSLMEKLRFACFKADVTPWQWIGAGAIAAAVLKQRNVRKYHKYDDDLTDEVGVDAIRRAYFGGRVELLKQGDFHHVKAVDLNSAYPWCITLLPSLRTASLEPVTDFQPDSHGIWQVQWNDVSGKLMPFPVRHKKDIYYPRSGRGWYHTCEVQSVLALGYPVSVIQGYVLRYDDIEPFGWVSELYDIRARWKQEGNAAEKALKLGLNSLYGKFAQGVATRGRPPWQSYFWAGEVTARTRSVMLRLAHLVDEPIMFATDGLFCQDVHDLECSDALGGVSLTEYDELFAVRPGVYSGLIDGREVLRSRGFKPSEVDFWEMRDQWLLEGVTGAFHYRSRRFVGLGVALHRRDFSVWRRWETAGEDGLPERTLNFLPSCKTVDIMTGEFHPYAARLPESEPYEPRDRLADVEERLQSADQPMKLEV